MKRPKTTTDDATLATRRDDINPTALSVGLWIASAFFVGLAVAGTVFWR